MTISFIIPVFNAEKYIDRCITSIVAQGLNVKDFEIIAVNDGSEDDSLKVLQRLKLGLDNLRILNTDNRGAGAARNVGLQNSIGEIVTFVDADDYIEPGCYANFIEQFLTEKLDILGFETKSVRGTKAHITRSLSRDYGLVMTGEQLILKYTNGFGPCGKLYRRGLFFENNLFFLEGIIPEDIELVPKLFLASDRIKLVDKPAYNYEFNPESVTKKKSTKAYLKRIEGLLIVILSLKKVAESYYDKNNNVYNYLHDNIINKCILELYYFINTKVVLEYKYLKHIHTHLLVNNLVPIMIIKNQWFQLYLINSHWLHVILYYTHILKAFYLLKRVWHKSIYVLSKNKVVGYEV